MCWLVLNPCVYLELPPDRVHRRKTGKHLEAPWENLLSLTRQQLRNRHWPEMCRIGFQQRARTRLECQMRPQVTTISGSLQTSWLGNAWIPVSLTTSQTNREQKWGPWQPGSSACGALCDHLRKMRAGHCLPAPLCKIKANMIRVNGNHYWIASQVSNSITLIM